ncbi:MAG: ABC transporter permease [Patescibacteria group bacterium]
MKIIDTLHETYTALSSNKVRSGLTMLGIVIGISSVIALTSIGNGAKASIEGNIEKLGSNLLTVVPGVVQPGRGIVSSGRGAAQNLKLPDVDIIKKIDGVREVAPELDRKFQIVSNTGNNTNSTVIGTIPEYLSLKNLSLQEGSFISESNNRSLSRVAILGPTAASDLFGEESPIDKNVRINGSNFKVIGVLNQKGSGGFFNPDDAVFIPLSVMQKILTGADYLSSITVGVYDKDIMDQVKESMFDAISVKHRVDPASPDFSIFSQADILGALTQITDTFTIFLASVAGISLIVGGIGIMNMMLTTVTERTREIGLRKAIGAKRKDINIQFLIEAVVLTFTGGLVGVLLGWAISFIISSLGIIDTSITMGSVILAFSVSAFIGIIFGYYPARRASRLNPIEALRYE